MDKHGHRNQKSTKEAKDSKPKPRKVKPWSTEGLQAVTIDTKLDDVGYRLLQLTLRYNRLGLGELVNDQLDNSKDEGAVAEARGAHDEEGGVRRRPNMTFTGRLRAMDDWLGDMDTNIYNLSNDVEDLTYVVSGMSEQYDQFYGEFGHMRMEPI
ncbi:hypothetical protein Tco_1072378, partial [Tanacetum coccineum]